MPYLLQFHRTLIIFICVFSWLHCPNSFEFYFIWFSIVDKKPKTWKGIQILGVRLGKRRQTNGSCPLQDSRKVKWEKKMKYKRKRSRDVLFCSGFLQLSSALKFLNPHYFWQIFFYIVKIRSTQYWLYYFTSILLLLKLYDK